MPPATKRSIGQILPLLKNEFPDITISKIRFLESEGLVAPERAPSGYRRYAQSDVERLRYILRMQRDHYLPLKVIRENLALIDQGIEPPTVETPGAAQPVLTASEAESEQTNAARNTSQTNRANRPLKMTRRELLQASGVAEATLIEMERQKMILPRRGSMYYGREALTMCIVARKLQSYGMDTRHLRAIKQFAEREAGLVEQAAAPHMGRAGEAAKVIHEVSQLVVHAHAAMMYTLLER